MWLDQGFTDEVTATNGGTALWSRAAWDALIPALSDHTLCPPTQTDDGKPLASGELVAAQCAEILGILPFDFHVYDGTGAIQRNGVPLEPGPPHGERLDWLAQAATRAGHWAWIDGMNSAWQVAIWDQYEAMYGAWGKLGERNWLDGEDGNLRVSPSITPPPSMPPSDSSTSTGGGAWEPPKDDANFPACYQAAFTCMRGLLQSGRSGPTSARPLTLDVVEDCLIESCVKTRYTHAYRGEERHMCYLLRETDGVENTERLLKLGWGWRTPHGSGDPHRLLWVIDESGDTGTREDLLRVPDWPTLPEGKRMMAALKAWVSEGASSAHCRWLYVGTSTDWVNARTMTALVRGLPDVIPLRLGVHLHEESGASTLVDAPALARQLLSRAALDGVLQAAAALVEEGGGASSWGDDVNAAAWAKGVIPVNTYTLDVANFGPITDWAFQQPHYLQGWGVIVDQNYERAHKILESYWSGIYGQCFNVTNTWKREACGWFFDNWGYPSPEASRGEGARGRGVRVRAAK